MWKTITRVQSTTQKRGVFYDSVTNSLLWPFPTWHVSTYISLFSSENAAMLNCSLAAWSFRYISVFLKLTVHSTYTEILSQYELLIWLIFFFLFWFFFIHTWLNEENLYTQFIIFSNFNLTDKNNNHICFNEKSSFPPFMNDKLCSIIKFPDSILSRKFEIFGRRELINWFGRITLASKN